MYNDFKELLSALNARRVRYLIVGGYAVSFHAEPRATKDLDILISPDTENSKAVYAALAQFGAPVEGLSAKDFAEPDGFFRMGTPPVMVDILSKIGGVEFVDEILRERARGRENWLEIRRKRIERSSTPAPDRSHDKNGFTRDADKCIDDDIET